MNETLVTIVGNVATEPETQVTATGLSVTRFRVATSTRRFDAERGAWIDGPTSFYSVRAWRALAGNIKESVCLGEPLVIQGRLRIREEEVDGKRYVTAEVDAQSIGHDLSRGVARFTRSHANPSAPRQQSGTPAPAEAAAVP